MEERTMSKAGKILIILALPVLIVVFQPSVSHGRWISHHTTYGCIWYTDEGALETLFKRLHVNSLGRGLLALFGGSDYSEQRLNEEINRLFHRVGALLGLRTDSVRVQIKVYKDKYSMDAEALSFWKGKMPTAFYLPSLNTIYISLDTVNASIVAREFTHVLLDHSFTEQVPTPTQEILSKYIELNM